MTNESSNKNSDNSSSSLFHRGEKTLQIMVGREAFMESFGQRAITNHMPDQHREFYAQLSFIVLGSVDAEGWPWASILSGHPGFAHSPEPLTLQVDALPNQADPLRENIQNGAPIGMLGIELHTRRRNRLNATISAVSDTSFSLQVGQAFGNCPRYIQIRDIEFVREPQPETQTIKAYQFTDFDDAACDMIRAADTFFVSSYLPSETGDVTEGVDVSHRGGEVGFVSIAGNALTIPDYSGNNMFSTLGNFLLNPKAGLIFPNFSTGELLMLTGTVEILHDEEGGRAWQFTLDHGVRLPHALPFRVTA